MSSISNFSNSNNNNQGNPFNNTNSIPQVQVQESIEGILVNYNSLAKEGKFKPLRHREDILLSLISVLRTTRHPNALLIGEAGTGKTGIVEELARRIQSNDPIASDLLKDYEIFELPIGNLIAGNRYVGDIEQAVKEVVDFATDTTRKVILFIDEIHLLASDSSESPTGKVAEILKPALARGDMRVIGATTTQESRKLKNPAFNRRFSKILVPELTVEQTVEVLNDVAIEFQTFHKIQVPQAILPEVVKIADQRLTNVSRPDNAITLLDRSISDMVVNIRKTMTMNPSIVSAITNTPTLTVTQIEKSAMNQLNLDPAIIQNRSREVETILKNEIIGQEEAVDTVIKSVKRKNLRLIKNQRPESYLLAGPSGTGKTETAYKLAEGLYGDKSKLIYLNMTEYSNEASLNRILGSPEGYVGSNSTKPLIFDALESNPYNIVVLDEFEKAHPDVQRLFMQALDEGEFETNKGNVVNFKEAIIIATTNAGVSELNRNGIGFGNNQHKLEKATKKEIILALSKSFPTELLNRFQNIITYNSLSKEEFANILKLKYNKINAEIRYNRPDKTFLPEVLNFDAEYEFINELVQQNYNAELNGRPAERAIMALFETAILENEDAYTFDFTQPNYGVVKSTFGLVNNPPN